jgi:hypothetical protein
MRTVSANHCLRLVLLSAGLAIAAGCASSSDDELGTVAIDLVGQAPSGASYQLRNATLVVTGPGYSKTWNTEDDPSRTALVDHVSPGSYSAVLQDGWHLERIVGSASVAVNAELTSPNPATFSVMSGQITSVTLQFHVDGDTLDLTGGYAIGVAIDEPALRGELIVPNINTALGERSSIWVFSADATGDVTALRRLSGSTTTLSGPDAAIVVGDQLIVADENTNAIDFFPRTANGDTSPTKQIIGSATDLRNPADLAFASGEIYVLTRFGVRVYPLSAIDNSGPTRSIPLPELTAKHIAFDNGELYVAFQHTGIEQSVRVYSAGGSLVRSILSSTPGFCPSGIALSGGELFVADVCNRTVEVFPQTASGPVVPSRVIRGSSTGLGIVGSLAVFQGELYVVDSTSDIRVFAAGASGNAVPVRVLAGTHTGLNSPQNVFVH